jgi:glycogen operon protein
MAFDAQDVPPAAAARGLCNYWGYSTHSFYSPHPRYCVDPASAPQEFRALTDAMHAAGIGVLLDVAFNHTAEAGASGPVINFKGLANDIFYHLDAGDRRHYRDYTGCGNTVNCNHPLVTAFIVRCLEYWVQELGVDGFRFDLASVFARDQHGDLLGDRVFSGTFARAADRRSVGRRRSLSGRCIPRHGLGGMERALSGCNPSFRAR